MTPENKANYDARVKRLNDSLELREPDRVPIALSQFLYPFFNSQYSIADIVYDDDLSKTKECLLKYANEYKPDNLGNIESTLCGMGRIMEIIGPKDMTWSGMPQNLIGKNSPQQHLEFPILMDDEYDFFFADRTGWALNCALPRTTKLLEPFSKFNIPTNAFRNANMFCSLFGNPEMRETIQKMWQVSDLLEANRKGMDSVKQALYEAGYPHLRTGHAQVPFDVYSDFLRGTILSFTDIYDYPEEVEKFMDESLESILNAIEAGKGKNDGERVGMMLHKGLDGFISGTHYEKVYWKYLKKIIVAIVEAGKVPYLFCEGKYDSRLDFLADVPKGKVLYRFETIDLKTAKAKLGNSACFSGGYPVYLLDHGTKQQVIDECKRVLDICAPGGGYQFDADCGLNNAKPENVEALFETLHTYGKY